MTEEEKRLRGRVSDLSDSMLDDARLLDAYRQLETAARSHHHVTIIGCGICAALNVVDRAKERKGA